MLLTGPVALLARLAASAVTIQPELHFVLEHVLWAGLAILEWRLLLGTAARVSPTRWRTVMAVGLSVAGVLAGLASWRTRWPLVYAGESVSWGLMDRPVALFGLAVLPVLWLWAQQQSRRGPP